MCLSLLWFDYGVKPNFQRETLDTIKPLIQTFLHSFYLYQYKVISIEM